jgi:hypothetical protein
MLKGRRENTKEKKENFKRDKIWTWRTEKQRNDQDKENENREEEEEVQE